MNQEVTVDPVRAHAGLQGTNPNAIPNPSCLLTELQMWGRVLDTDLTSGKVGPTPGLRHTYNCLGQLDVRRNGQSASGFWRKIFFPDKRGRSTKKEASAFTALNVEVMLKNMRLSPASVAQ